MTRALRLFSLVLCLLWPFAAKAQDASPADPLDTPARHVAILDFETGQLLHCEECRVAMPPASMSKLMTTLIVAEKLEAGVIKPEQRFLVSERAWRFGAQSDGSHMFLPLNGQVSVSDLLQGVIVASANDACIVLSEGIAGSEAAFVEMMNARARDLGLKTAQFKNSTGLPDPGHVISPEDLAKLLAHIIREHPEVYALYAQQQMTLADPELDAKNRRAFNQNRNPLLGRFPGVDGGKTGHTSVSGYGLIVSAVNADGVRRIVVFNGLRTMAERASEAEALMRAAFGQFEVVRVFEAGAQVGEAELWLGAKPTAPLLAKAPVVLAGRRAVIDRLKAEIVYRAPHPAPVKAGEQIAELVISGPGFETQRHPLVSARDVGRRNIFGRAAYGLSVLLGGS